MRDVLLNNLSESVKFQMNLKFAMPEKLLFVGHRFVKRKLVFGRQREELSEIDHLFMFSRIVRIN